MLALELAVVVVVLFLVATPVAVPSAERAPQSTPRSLNLLRVLMESAFRMKRWSTLPCLVRHRR